MKRNVSQLKDFFAKNKTFNREKLNEFYIKNTKNNSKEDFFWYLCELLQNNIIKNIGNDYFQIISPPKIFLPKEDAFLREVNDCLLSNFSLTQYVIWQTSWLNEFTTHQSMQNFIFLEVEKEAITFVFNVLNSKYQKNIFFLQNKSDYKTLENYISQAENPIIISKIISKSPIQKNNNIIFPKLEKILVDLFCDEDILGAFKGNEQNIIFKNALNTYVINLKTLFSYAKRRKKEIQLKTYLYQNFQNEIKLLL